MAVVVSEEDPPANMPTYEKPGFLEMCVSPMDAPDEPETVEIDFVQGAPVAVNGDYMTMKEIIISAERIWVT